MVFTAYDPALSWIADNWFTIVIIVILALLAEVFGEVIIKSAIRRTVHGHHFGKAKAASIDVKKRQDTIISLTTVLWKTAVFVVAGFSLFQIFFPSVNLLPFLTTAGVIAAVVGFGAQSMIKDLISGIFIIAENQFRIGDVIEIEEASGTVEHITLRSTVLRDISGNVHYVTNGSIIHVINKTMGYSKVNFALPVHPDTDIDKLVSIINSIGEKLASNEKWEKKIIEAPHFINLGDIGETVLEVNISGTTKPGEQWGVTSEYKKRLLKELKQHKDIKLPQFADPIEK